MNMCFDNSCEQANLKQNEPLSTFKVLISLNIPLKTNSVMTGKQCARCCSFEHRCFSLERYICSFTSGEQASLEQTKPTSTFKHLS
jgi:hypothetical protein